LKKDTKLQKNIIFINFNCIICTLFWKYIRCK